MRSTNSILAIITQTSSSSVNDVLSTPALTYSWHFFLPDMIAIVWGSLQGHLWQRSSYTCLLFRVFKSGGDEVDFMKEVFYQWEFNWSSICKKEEKDIVKEELLQKRCGHLAVFCLSPFLTFLPSNLKHIIIVIMGKRDFIRISDAASQQGHLAKYCWGKL